jgi:hypothetical protein
MSTRESEYPERVEDVLDPTMAFAPELIACAQHFAQSRPWRGTLAQRRAKFRRFHARLAAVQGVKQPRLVLATPATTDSGRSCYIPALDTIILHGLSVVTLLHEWGHRLYGPSERESCRWSLNLFKLSFPISFSRCRFDGHMLHSPRTLTA